MAPEVLATVSYGTGQALEVTDGSCIRGLESHTIIGNQIASRVTEQKNKFYSLKGPELK
jgi:hypothetical protein